MMRLGAAVYFHYLVLPKSNFQQMQMSEKVKINDHTTLLLVPTIFQGIIMI